jgi:hypothetical protein
MGDNIFTNFINWDYLHMASVFYMTGVIWLVQLVHYPLMSKVHPDLFIDFHNQHSSRITYVVGPMMLVQLASSYFVSEWHWVWLGLSISSFALTFLVSVPIHNKLAHGWNPSLHNKLVLSNWPRTAVWTAHSLLLIYKLSF